MITQPDLLLLDEPSNHLDLPSLLWLESFLSNWRGTFLLVSHDQRLLDRVCNSTIILRDRTLSFFSLPCSAAREALRNRDEADLRRHQGEQKEIDRIEQSAKRLAIWGQVYDNETFSRKAQSMEKRLSKLRENQTDLTDGTPWTLQLHGLDMKQIAYWILQIWSSARHRTCLLSFKPMACRCAAGITSDWSVAMVAVNPLYCVSYGNTGRTRWTWTG
ncbi:ABC-type multidrug transport system ATPase [Alcaligenes sp. HPC1271]|nr:ATP-binding cassette domain-containing protein [Alcaligenes sp. HPC1271]EKU30875.1 ABC-type multidrug transport system ATPase [Alcaligenes sp. HPC1271]